MSEAASRRGDLAESAWDCLNSQLIALFADDRVQLAHTTVPVSGEHCLMDITIVIALIAIILFFAYLAWSLTQSLKAIERRVVAIEERVSDLEDEFAKRG